MTVALDLRRRVVQRWAIAPVLVMVLAVTLLVSIGLGALDIPPRQVLAILVRPLHVELPWTYSPEAEAVVWVVRLPRVLFGALAGATLATAGAALQGIFRNPLADPALIGVSSGASVGAASMMVFAHLVPAGLAALQLMLVPTAAFVGALGTTLLVVHVASNSSTPAATMLLCGVAINAVAGAATGMLTYVATDAQLRGIAFWQLGSFGGVTWEVASFAAVLLLITIVALPYFGASLNLLQLGDAEAGHLGVRVHRLRRIIVSLVALGVGASVAVTGMIGFVGLVVPHVARLLFGPDQRHLLPRSALLGATLVVLADLVARTVVAPSELPIGIVTALVGAPFFLSLVLRWRPELGA